LRCFGLRPPGASVISCPTCGRVQIDVVTLAQRVEAELDRYYRSAPDLPRPVVAVMGCVVNGPGEAREADIAIAGGQGKAALYVRGVSVATVPEADILDRLMEQVRAWKP
jgi:(E)-4-hydroxy-3-methylbut-2-enyl-diphosphate synthase